MYQQYVAPVFREGIFTCPHCQAFSAHNWASLYRDDPDGDQGVLEEVEKVPTQSGFWMNPTWTVSWCIGCKQYAFWCGEEMRYPDRSALKSEVPPPSDDMPDSIQKLYCEAAAVLPHSRRASAALCRATLDILTQDARIISDESVRKRKLNGRLDHLAKLVPSHLAQLLHVIRHVGNKSLHEGDASDDAVAAFLMGADGAAAEAYFEAINNLVDELITKPNRASRAFNQLPQSVRDNIPPFGQMEADTPL